MFLAGGIRELRDRLPGMMTLISLAISVAFFFSWRCRSATRGCSLVELATLVTIMLLGHWIEMRSIFQASGALQELAKLLPSTAMRVVGERSRRSRSPRSARGTWCSFDLAQASPPTASSRTERAPSTKR